MKGKSKSFGYRFAMLNRLNTSLFSEGIKKLGITRSQVPFVAILLESGGEYTQDQLSAELEIDKAATARALDQLEKKGMVQRRVNPYNRRQKLVQATGEAKLVEDAFFKILQESSGVFVRGFSPEEKRLLLDLMDRMMENARNEKYDRQIG